jgi:hypothetical protein
MQSSLPSLTNLRHTEWDDTKMDGDDRGRLNTLKKDYESLRMHLDEGTDQEAAVKILEKWKKEKKRMATMHGV